MPLPTDEIVQIQFYTDTHIDKQVAVQLRNKGVGVIRCEEVGLATASDQQHLEYATRQQMILITKDDDFIRLHLEWHDQEKEHGGILFCPYRDRPVVGLIVNECLYYAEAIKSGAGTYEDDLKNKLHYIT